MSSSQARLLEGRGRFRMQGGHELKTRYVTENSKSTAQSHKGPPRGAAEAGRRAGQLVLALVAMPHDLVRQQLREQPSGTVPEGIEYDELCHAGFKDEVEEHRWLEGSAHVGGGCSHSVLAAERLSVVQTLTHSRRSLKRWSHADETSIDRMAGDTVRRSIIRDRQGGGAASAKASLTPSALLARDRSRRRRRGAPSSPSSPSLWAPSFISRGPSFRESPRRRPNRCLIDPRKSRWLGYFDSLGVIALIFTALVTPWEVRHLSPPAAPHAWTPRAPSGFCAAPLSRTQSRRQALSAGGSARQAERAGRTGG